MNITYDKKADALYIHFKKGVFVTNKEVEEGIVLDIGKKNTIPSIPFRIKEIENDLIFSRCWKNP